MTTVLLVRHGLTAMTGPVLAGRTPGVHLDERGQAQARAVAERLAPLPLAAIVTSPLDRCRETAAAIREGRDGTPLRQDKRFIECEYGEWTGRPLKELSKQPLWKVVQAHPSAAVFPGGEAMAAAQARAIAGIRAWNTELGADATYAVVSHGDIIKAVLADALGLHLDQFQRLAVDPCSVTVIRYTELRPFVLRTNDTGGGVADLLPPKRTRRSRRSSDATVGGGAGGGSV